jgi:signal transduction histidine kinase/ActR/RegA family two-component response regulator
MTSIHDEDNPNAIAPITDWISRFGPTFNLGICILSKDWKVLYSNDLIYEYLDLEKGFLQKFNSYSQMAQEITELGYFHEGMGGNYHDDYEEAIRAFFDSSSSKMDPVKIYPPNGKIVKAERFIDDDKNITIIIQDCTEAHKRQKALDIALTVGKAGYWYHNFDTGEFKVYGSYLESLLTQSEKDAVDQNGFLVIMHPDDREKSLSDWNDAVAKRSSFSNVARIKTAENGIFWFKSHAQPKLSTSGEIKSITCYFEDVTDQLQLEDDLRSAKIQAEKTLQAQNSFLARLAHEVRTPMNAVVGITDALLQHSTSPDLDPKLSLIQSSADSIMNILESSLSRGKLDADKLQLDPQTNNPGDTVRQVCELWKSQAEKNGTRIRCAIDDSVPETIIFDRFRYEQCLNNLLSNAVKFTHQGKIDVILTLTGEQNSVPRLVVAVKDTGIGMTKEQQAHIFNAYSQADVTISSRFGGTGLGMNITKQIIELMDGKISMQSKIGEGSIFALSLPVELDVIEEVDTDENLIDQILEPHVEENALYSNLKILVADDNETNHMVVESLLSNVVSEIHTANNGREVLDILNVNDIDIVLMDIHMPVMDGIEATLAIRNSTKHWSDILIIAITADPQYQQLRLCKNIGMDETLAKPVKLTGILEAFDNVLKIDRKNTPYKDAFKAAS